LEETNFHRDQVQSTNSSILSAEKPSLKDETEASTTEIETTRGAEHEILTDNPSSDLETKREFPKKSYLQKLKLFDGKAFRYPNRILDMILRPLSFLTFPIIVYAGISYGSTIVWFNVLNGTALLILSKKPYEFSSSMVGLSYLSPLLGVLLGYVP